MMDQTAVPAVRRPHLALVLMFGVLSTVGGGCADVQAQHDHTAPAVSTTTSVEPVTTHLDPSPTIAVEPSEPAPTPASTVTTTTAPDVPPNVYAATGAGGVSPAEANDKAYAYVPMNDDGSVTVIDQATLQVVDHYHVGKLVQHVVAD